MGLDATGHPPVLRVRVALSGINPEGVIHSDQSSQGRHADRSDYIQLFYNPSRHHKHFGFVSPEVLRLRLTLLMPCPQHLLAPAES